jgi:hypothetical protein
VPRYQFARKIAEARDVATRMGETGDEPYSDRVVDAAEDDRDRRGCVFRRQCHGRTAARHEHGDLLADEFGGQRGQPVVVTFGPTVFDRYGLSIDEAGFAQALNEGRN